MGPAARLFTGPAQQASFDQFSGSQYVLTFGYILTFLTFIFVIGLPYL